MRATRLLLGLCAVAAVVGLLVSSASGVSGAARIAPAGGPTTYDATFGETGLPSGTNWSVHVQYIGCGCDGFHGTVSSTTDSIEAALTNGSYRYHILLLSGFYVVGIAHGTLNVSGGAPAPVAVTFAAVEEYPVEFTETGLPHGTSWTVHVSGNGRGQAHTLEQVAITTSRPALNFSLMNATYQYSVDAINGSYFDGPATGRFTVAGAGAPPISVAFVTPTRYAVYFNETGLLAGLTWSIAVHGRSSFPVLPIRVGSSSTGPTNEVFLPNGTYQYRIAEDLGYVLGGPSSGSFRVAGAPIGFTAPFRAVGSGSLFLVDVNETGLASGTAWTVHIAATHNFGRGGHTTATVTSATSSFALQNGTYRFTVGRVTGYVLGTAPGTFAVDGASPATIAVVYTAIPTYAGTFNETGLANGTAWSVLVYTSPGTTSAFKVHERLTEGEGNLTFSLPDGTFCYRIYAVHGYRLTSGSATGSFTVDGGSPATVTVGFTARG